MADDVNFDAGLESFGLGGDATPASPETSPDQATSAAEALLKYGGREFKSQEDLGKAYEGLLKDYSKTKGEFAKAKPWYEFGQNVQKHPELYQELNSRVQEYVKRIQAGQSQTTAQKASGLPDAVVEELSSIKQQLADRAVKEEIADIKSKYNLDQPTLNEVIQFASERPQLPLEDAYWAVVWKKQAATSRSEAEKTVREELKKKAASNVGPSRTPQITPSQKSVTDMSEQERREHLKQLIRSTQNQG